MAARAPRRVDLVDRIRTGYFVVLVILVVQFLLGMAVNLMVAGLNGGSFLNYNEDFSSMIMAAFFAVAVVSYVTGLYLLPGDPAA
jgi:uncharacterized membrane protein